MATGRDTVDSVGLGELHLDTRSGSVTTEQRSAQEDPWAQLSEQLAWEQRCTPADPPKAPPLILAEDGLLDDLPPRSFALSTSELTAANAEFQPSPASLEAAAAPVLPASPSEPRSAPQVQSTAPLLAPSPAVAPALGTDGQASQPRRESPAADELPTGPSLLDKSAAAPRVRWRAKAQERGLRSAFVAAADDFSAPAAGPRVAAVPSPVPAAAAMPPPLPASEQVTPPAVSAARPRSEASLNQTALPAEASLRAEPSAASAEMSRLLATAPPDTSPRQSSQQGEPGRLFRALQRPRPAAAPPQSKPTSSPPAPPPAPPPARSAGSALAAEVAQAVKQSIQRGQQLLRQLLRPRGADDARARPEAPPATGTAPGADGKKG